uniref:Uncharacterized protein n=1 Tax=Lepeophtheirus salmonis TaxID=72036 RepID=A0A0K2UB40_LEPSM
MDTIMARDPLKLSLLTDKEMPLFLMDMVIDFTTVRDLLKMIPLTDMDTVPFRTNTATNTSIQRDPLFPSLPTDMHHMFRDMAVNAVTKKIFCKYVQLIEKLFL